MSHPHRRAGFLIASVVLAGALAPAATQSEDRGKALAVEQLDLAQQALKDLDLLYKNGRMSLDGPKYDLWMRRRIEALRATGASKAEILTALDGYLKRLKELEGLVEGLHQKGQGTSVDVYDAKYRRLDAEMWRDREQAR